jgi:hypothetical protein
VEACEYASGQGRRLRLRKGSGLAAENLEFRRLFDRQYFERILHSIHV